MELGLKGKVAIVGGSSQVIGYGIALLLASEGAAVALVARKVGLKAPVKGSIVETRG